MPALQSLAAAHTMPNLDIKLPHDLLAYDLLLILGLDLILDGAAAAGTMLWQRRYIALIHRCRNRTAVVLAMLGSGLATVGLGLPFPLAPGKRGGLSLQSTTSLFQFFLQPLDFSLQPFVLLAQALNLIQRPIQFRLGNKLQGLWISLRCRSRPPGLVLSCHPGKLWHGPGQKSSPLLMLLPCL